MNAGQFVNSGLTGFSPIDLSPDRWRACLGKYLFEHGFVRGGFARISSNYTQLQALTSNLLRR